MPRQHAGLRASLTNRGAIDTLTVPSLVPSAPSWGDADDPQGFTQRVAVHFHYGDQQRDGQDGKGSHKGTTKTDGKALPGGQPC